MFTRLQHHALLSCFLLEVCFKCLCQAMHGSSLPMKSERHTFAVKQNYPVVDSPLLWLNILIFFVVRALIASSLLPASSRLRKGELAQCRRVSRCPAMAAPDLLWECVKPCPQPEVAPGACFSCQLARNNSSFIRKNKNVPTMTAEPGRDAHADQLLTS